MTDVVFLRELDGNGIFAVFPNDGACVGRPDLMTCYAPSYQHSRIGIDECHECDEVTDADEFADLFNELECRGYELYVIRKDRFNDPKYAESRKREAGPPM